MGSQSCNLCGKASLDLGVFCPVRPERGQREQQSFRDGNRPLQTAASAPRTVPRAGVQCTGCSPGHTGRGRVTVRVLVAGNDSHVS